MNEITINGTDGTLMRYYAVSGGEFSPTEIGWFLTVARPGREPVVQALTVAEVLGDLRAMMPDDTSSRDAAIVFTEEMIKSLDGRVEQLERGREDASKFRGRAGELRRELAEALADTSAAADDA